MSLDALQDRVVEILATIFSLPKEGITSDTSPATIENWDSMGHLMLVLDLEQQFGVEFSPEEVENLSSVSAIVNVLHGKRVQGSVAN